MNARALHHRVSGLVRATAVLDAARDEAIRMPFHPAVRWGLEVAKRRAAWAWRRLPLHLRRQIQNPGEELEAPQPIDHEHQMKDRAMRGMWT